LQKRHRSVSKKSVQTNGASTGFN